MGTQQVRRRIRAAGYAALAFAVFQLLMLPMALRREPGGWVVEWETVANVGASLALAAGALRAMRPAALVLGTYGAYRMALALLAIVRVFDGTAVRTPNGPAWVISMVIALPFAYFWVRGGVAALRSYREQAAAAAPPAA